MSFPPAAGAGAPPAGLVTLFAVIHAETAGGGVSPFT